MGHRTTRMALGKERAREARLQRLLERQHLDDRTDDALSRIGDAYPKLREARAAWLQLELTVGQALLQLAADRVLVSEMAARTGLPIAECRRLIRAARASGATPRTEDGRY